MPQTVAGARKTAAAHAGLTLTEYEARIAAGLKRCTRCKAWVPVANFDQDRTRQDGLTAACKPCRRVVALRTRSLMEPASAVQRGHDAVRWAIRRGHLPAPTSLTCPCGSPAREYHHPRGYAGHELDVQALCRSCHQKEHWL